jgi:hypothetical protein
MMFLLEVLQELAVTRAFIPMSANVLASQVKVALSPKNTPFLQGKYSNLW